MYVVFVGPDRDLGSALEARGAELARVEGVATGHALRAAGVQDAALLVLTDVGEATAVPVARELNPSLRIVVYTPNALPEFVRGQVDLVVSPGVLSAAVVAEELTDSA